MMAEPEIAFCLKTTSQVTAIKIFSHGCQTKYAVWHSVDQNVFFFSCQFPKMNIAIIIEAYLIFIKEHIW